MAHSSSSFESCCSTGAKPQLAIVLLVSVTLLRMRLLQQSSLWRCWLATTYLLGSSVKLMLLLIGVCLEVKVVLRRQFRCRQWDNGQVPLINMSCSYPSRRPAATPASACTQHLGWPGGLAQARRVGQACVLLPNQLRLLNLQSTLGACTGSTNGDSITMKG